MSAPAKELSREVAPVAAASSLPVPIVDAAPTSLLPAIITLAKDPTVDVAKLQALLQMQERMEVRSAEAAFNAAFVVMQPKLPRIKKDGSLTYPVKKDQPDGPQRLIAKFATWEAIDGVIRPILTEHGFALSFTTARGADGVLTVSAVLRHEGGHSTEVPGPPLPCDSSGGKNNIQGWGSAMSYGKRYAATAALNLITEGEDDDAKLAGMSFVTDAQQKEMRDLMTGLDMDETAERRFLDIMGVMHLGEIQQGGFAAAKNMLLAKKPKKKEVGHADQ